MIVGVGVDLVEVARIARALETWGARLEQRLFTAAEAAYCRGQRHAAQAFAARLAAKEAFGKALGTGIGRGVRWVDVEVTRVDGGRPGLGLAGGARSMAEAHGARLAHVSLSHDGGMAVAVVVLEG